jgi:hypothetical protein
MLWFIIVIAVVIFLIGLKILRSGSDADALDEKNHDSMKESQKSTKQD